MAAPKTLGQALLLAQDAMPKLALDAENPHFHSKFVSLPALLDAVKPILNANGLILAQHPTHLEDGSPALRTQIIHAETFEFIESTMPLVLSKQDPQGLGSAITYGRRYSLMSVLGLAGDEDDDGNAASRGASDGAVTPRVTSSVPAPAPASSAFKVPDAVVKAQEAQEKNGATVRPDQPVSVGDGKFAATTFVQHVEKKDNGWCEITVVLNGQPAVLATKLVKLIDKAEGLLNTSVSVEWKEQPSKNPDKYPPSRYLNAIEPAEGLDEAFAGVAGGLSSADEDIPFDKAVW